MKVREIMNQKIQCIDPGVRIADVAKKMRDGDFGVMPVCESGRPIGMITDRDIAVRVVAEQKDLGTRVEEVMTPGTITCRDDDDINQIALVMSENQIRRLVVLDNDSRMVGMVSLGDIARHARTAEKAEEALAEISQPTHNEPGARMQDRNLSH